MEAIIFKLPKVGGSDMRYALYLIYPLIILFCSSAFAEKPISQKTYDGVTIEKFEDYQKIETNGFIFKLPKNFEINSHGEGTILAVGGKDQENYIDITMYYYTIPSPASQQDIISFIELQKTHPFNELFQALLEEQTQKKIEHYNKAITYHNNVKVEKADIEYLVTNYQTKKYETYEVRLEQEKKHMVPSCSFIRIYHAPKAEVYFVVFFVNDKCKSTRPKFEAIEKSFIWKK